MRRYKKDSAQFILDKYNWDLVVDQMLRIYSGDVIDYPQIVKENERKRTL